MLLKSCLFSCPSPFSSSFGGMREAVDMSWVIKDNQTKEVVCEIFNEKLLNKLNTKKYEAVPVKEHLEQLNKELNGGMTYKDKVDG